MTAVYQEWADEMGNVSIGAIQHGVKKAAKMQFPPSLGDFITCCEGYAPKEQNIFLIEKKLSAEQIEQNRQRMQEILAKFGANK